VKIRIALDQSIGAKRKKQLNDLGYEVVVTADHAETDESWMNRAFAAGAVFAVSPDLDIPRIIENQRYPMAWINYPLDNQDFKNDLVKFIHESIQFKVKVYREMIAPTPKIVVKKEKKSIIQIILEKLKKAG